MLKLFLNTTVISFNFLKRKIKSYLIYLDNFNLTSVLKHTWLQRDNVLLKMFLFILRKRMAKVTSLH